MRLSAATPAREAARGRFARWLLLSVRQVPSRRVSARTEGTLEGASHVEGSAVNGTHPEDTPAKRNPKGSNEGSGKQFAEDVTAVEETAEGEEEHEGGKGFSKGAPPYPTPDPTPPSEPPERSNP